MACEGRIRKESPWSLAAGKQNVNLRAGQEYIQDIVLLGGFERLCRLGSLFSKIVTGGKKPIHCPESGWKSNDVNEKRPLE